MSYIVQFKSPRGDWITSSRDSSTPSRFDDRAEAERYAADKFRRDTWRAVFDPGAANTSFTWGTADDPRLPADGSWLRNTRELLLGATQAELAADIGVSTSQLHNWERGADRRTGAPCPVPRAVALAVEALVNRRVAAQAALDA